MYEDPEDVEELNILHSQGLEDYLVRSVCWCPSMAETIDYLCFLWPKLLRNIDQLLDFFIYYQYRNSKYEFTSMLLLAAICAASGIRWYVSMRHILQIANFNRSPFPGFRQLLWCYIIPVIGIPLHYVYDMLQNFVMPKLFKNDHPGVVLSQMEFDLAVHFMFEAVPALGFGLYISIDGKDTDPLLISSIVFSFIATLKATCSLRNKSMEFGFPLIKYVYLRIQNPETELTPLLPFADGLKSGRVAHVNLAAFPLNHDCLKLFSEIFGRDSEGNAGAPNLETLQLSPYCIDNLEPYDAYVLGTILNERGILPYLPPEKPKPARKMVSFEVLGGAITTEDEFVKHEEWEPVALYMLNLHSMESYNELWSDMDTDNNGTLEKDEFTNHYPGEKAFYQLSANREHIHKTQLAQQLFFDTTGPVGNFHLPGNRYIMFAIDHNMESFLMFCIGMGLHRKDEGTLRVFQSFQEVNSRHDIHVNSKDIVTLILSSFDADAAKMLLHTVLQHDLHVIDNCIYLNVKEGERDSQDNISLLVRNMPIIRDLCGNSSIEVAMLNMVKGKRQERWRRVVNDRKYLSTVKLAVCGLFGMNRDGDKSLERLSEEIARHIHIYDSNDLWELSQQMKKCEQWNSKVITIMIAMSLKYRKLDHLRFLLKHYGDVDWQDPDLVESFHMTLDDDSLELVQEMINFGVDVNMVNKETNENSLYTACSLGSKKIVQLLLNANADLNLESNETKHTPLDVASFNRHQDIVEMLRKRNAKHSKHAMQTVLKQNAMQSGI